MLCAAAECYSAPLEVPQRLAASGRELIGAGRELEPPLQIYPVLPDELSSLPGLQALPVRLSVELPRSRTLLIVLF
ncbi:MAG: hypothetical protein FJ125_03200 [Deltaproteobacteria bacterium]|nr:hypothetical protein [Deltaproteobacteria bacterium]